jgi:tetratricopeptide (TPR) repeat protein
MLPKVNHAGRSTIAVVKTVGPLVILLFLIWYAGRTGFAALLYTYATKTNQLAAADAAVRLSPDDANAHHIRGAIFEANGDYSMANADYVRAVSLRPDDYIFWLSLARIRELNGEMSSAIIAAREAVQLANYYSQPHWQLGNLLVRSGDQDTGFAELRLATASNPVLLPGVVDLAWQLSGGSTERVKQIIEPNTPAAYIALADCFMKRNKVTEAVEMIRAAGDDAKDRRRQFLNELVSTKRFPDAYSLWLLFQPAGTRGQPITNPGFEQQTDLDEPGFGWQAKKNQTVLLSLDQINPAEGKFSLEVEFKGDSEAGLPVMTQLVLVEPGAHYQLNFAARTKEVVSGGLPSLTITDAVSGSPLGDSGAFPKTTDGWRQYTVDFTVPKATSTIQIVLQRHGCSGSPCPIFGYLWLDSFSLRRL